MLEMTTEKNVRPLEQGLRGVYIYGGEKMTAKEYLGQVRQIEEDIRLKREQIDALRGRAEGITGLSGTLRVDGGQAESRLENAVVTLVEMQEELSREIEQMTRVRKEVSLSISQVHEPELRRLLEYRYLLFMKWDDIADKMNYSFRNIHYMHNKSLHGIAQLIGVRV